MDDITSLSGYEALRQGVIDALRQREANEPRWVFENEQTIDLANLAKDRRSRRNTNNGRTEFNGSDLAEKILLGRVFDAHEYFEDDDNCADQDEQWFEQELSQAFGKEMASAIESFAEDHELETDDVEEALKQDDELDLREVFDYSLHHSTYKFEGSVPMQIKLDVEVDLAPTLEAALGLYHLRIAPQDWIDAVARVAQDSPENALQFTLENDEEFDLTQFSKELASHVAALSSRGHVFAESGQEMVAPDALIDQMMNTWNVSKTDLLLRFNLGRDHVDDVSMPVARTLEEHEIDKMPVLLMDSVELMSNENYDSGKGEGLMLQRPYACTLGDLRLAGDDADDRPEPTSRLGGALGLLMRSYEALLEHEDSEKLIDIALAKNVESSAVEPVFLIPEQVASALRGLYADVDGFDAERIAAKYPGLVGFMPPMAAPCPEAMGLKLLNLMADAMLQSPKSWASSEARERCAWLVAQGADLHLRAGQGGAGPQAAHLAASIVDIDMVRALHERGVDTGATYRPQMAGDGQDVGVWEALVRRAVSLRQYDRSADASELVDALNWVESIGGGQAGMQVTPELRIHSSTILSHAHQLMGVDQAIAIIDDATLSTSYLRRLNGKDASFGGELLARTLLMGMNENSTSFCRACMDAGARTQAPLDNDTVEGLARRRAAKNSWSTNTAIDDAVAYCNALMAREAIDSLDHLMMKAPVKMARQGAAVRAGP